MHTSGKSARSRRSTMMQLQTTSNAHTHSPDSLVIEDTDRTDSAGTNFEGKF